MLRWRGLPLQLFALTILPLTLLLLAIAFGSLFLHQRSMRQLVGERDERAVRAAAAAIAEQLQHREAAIRGLALRTAGEQTPAHVLADATFLLPDFDGGIALFNDDLDLLVTSQNRPTWESAALDLFPPGADLRRAAGFSRLFVDERTGRALIALAAGAGDGVIAAGVFSPAALAEEALGDILSGGDEAAAMLTDGDGRLLFQLGNLHEPGADLSQYEGVAQALQGTSGTVYVDAGGDEKVVAFSPIPPLNWVLAIEEPWRAVTDPLLRLTEWAPLVLAPLLVFALIGLMFGLRQIVQPLQSLEKKAAGLGWGDFEAIEEPVGGIHEIQRLQTELIHMAQKVKLAQQSLRGYLGAVTAGQEEERRRLARDLHDDTIQSLIALNQRVQLAQMTAVDKSTAAQLVEMQQMTEQTIGDLRRLTRDLRPIYLEDLGLATALSMLARDTSQLLDIPVAMHVSGNEHRLPPEVELAFYRIAQEGLNNVARHARAGCAELRLDYSADATTLSVRDDGRGFVVPESPAEIGSRGHFGLLGIQERAESIGAQFTLESEPGRGTRLLITLGRAPASA